MSSQLLIACEDPLSWEVAPINGWVFDKASNYTYDNNYVEVSSGLAQLKQIDQYFSGSDFSTGQFVGTQLSGDRITLLYQADSDTTNFLNIFPAKSSSVIGYWRMDGNFNDSSSRSNHALEENGLDTGTLGLIGSAGDFDSLDDRAVVAHNSNQDISDDRLSIFAWVYYRGYDNYPTIISKSSVFRRIFINPGGTYTCRLNSTDIDVGSSAQTVQENTWVHIGCTYDGSTVRMYYNGIQIRAESNSFGLPATNTNDIVIGDYTPTGDRTFNGLIDELIMLNDTLDATEVATLYNTQSQNYTELSASWTPEFNSLHGYWKLDGNWLDSTVNANHGSITGDVNYTNVARVGSQASTFDGTADCVDFSALSLNDSYTVSIWFNAQPPVDTTSVMALFANAYGSHTSDGIKFHLHNWNTESFLVRAAIGNGSADSSFSSASNQFQYGTWHHAVLTANRSAGEAHIFVDGKEVASRYDTLTDYKLTGLFRAGKTRNSCTGTQWMFNGSLDDLAVWNTQLTAGDVKTIYNRQKQKFSGHYESPVIDLGANGNWSHLTTMTPLPFGKQLISDSSESASSYAELSADFSDELVGYWRFDEKASDSAPGGTDIEDYSSGSRHLTEQSTGGVYGLPGLQEQSLQGNGNANVYSATATGSYYTGSGGLLGSSVDWSFSFWLKPSAYSKHSFGDQSYVFANWGNNACRPCFSYDNYGQDDSGPVIIFRQNKGSGISEYVSMTSTKFILHQWNHVVVTFDGTTLQTYINGSADTSTVTTHSPSWITDDFIIGSWGNGGEAFGGRSNIPLDELAAWTRPLSTVEIKELYRRGANRVNYQVKSCVDPTCNCKIFNTSPVGSSTDCDGDGTPNSSDSNDIYKAKFIGPGGSDVTAFSERYNRSPGNMTYNCSANTTDTDSNICVDDEITLSNDPNTTSPTFSFFDFPSSARPQDNRYFQYRILMEADQNTSCTGQPCLPELTSVELGPTGRYNSLAPAIVTKIPTNVERSVSSISINASPMCLLTYQLSNDGSNFYYWDGSTWASGVSVNQSNTLTTLNANVASFSEQIGTGSLFIRSFLGTTNFNNCQLDSIQLNEK